MRSLKEKTIFAISGVAGAGKDSLLKYLREMDDKFAISVSFTDRPPREGEIDGQSYNFISKEEFTKAVENGEFIEWEKTRGETRYGKLRSEFEAVYNSGKTLVMQIDVLGAQKFKKMGYNIVTIFIIPPSIEEAIRRLKARNTDSEEDLKLRIERYELEMGFKGKYDHVIINDDLSRAQQELLEIIHKENEKRGHGKIFKNVFFNFFLLLFFAVLAGSAAAKYYIDKSDKPDNIKEIIASSAEDKKTENVEPVSTVSEPVQPPKDEVKVVAPPTKEVKKKIASEPPKQPTPQSTKIVEETKTNSDGSTTTTVSTGGDVAASDVERVAESTTKVASPNDIVYRDETGLYPDFGSELKDYLRITLKWRNEISSMKEITLRDAGASGWAGQYLGQYTVAPDGKDINDATGSIILNTYYYKTSPYFTDYMKLTLSHEYGHHYTLYHKWVDWDLTISDRFPDGYYVTRPLSKATTAVDYSLGWKNCESEVIAEDYSYFYSGYGYHAMSSTYGYPNAAIKTWLDNIGTQSLTEAIASNPPVLAIVSPLADNSLTGQISFTATATDDVSVSKVNFYIDNQLLAEDIIAPYETSFASNNYANGQHVLKAIAYDASLSTEKQITVIFANEVSDNIAPTISILEPASNPYILTVDSLSIQVLASDNQAISRIELYIDDEYQDSWSTSNLNLTVNFTGIPAGTYSFKFKSFDQAGNSAEIVLTVTKN